MYISTQPSLARVAVVAFYNDSDGKTPYMQSNTHEPHLLSKMMANRLRLCSAPLLLRALLLYQNRCSWSILFLFLSQINTKSPKVQVEHQNQVLFRQQKRALVITETLDEDERLSLIMSPKTHDFDRFLFFKNLINQAVLNVDPPRIKPL